MKYLLRKVLSWFLLFIIGLNIFGEGISENGYCMESLSSFSKSFSKPYTEKYRCKGPFTIINGEEVLYDVKGNMIYGPVDGEMTELTYDCRNRLTKAGKVSYTYDCENTRTATTEGGITTEYVTDTSGTLSRMLIAYENVGTAGASETHYYYGAEGLAYQNNNTSGQYFSYHYDNIGSTTLITDKTGRKVEEFAYGTYGEILTEVVNNIRFLYKRSYGVMTDSNGLYCMRASCCRNGGCRSGKVSKSRDESQKSRKDAVICCGCRCRSENCI